MTVCCCYRLNLPEHWCVTGVWNLWVGSCNCLSTHGLSAVNSCRNAFTKKSTFLSLYSPTLHLHLTGSHKSIRNQSEWMCMRPQLDAQTVLQLQIEDCSLLDVQLPQHFPASYSQHSLMKAITLSREKHFVWDSIETVILHFALFSIC